MSYLSRGILGTILISLTFGAVAWGRDLAGTQKPAGTSAATINRAGPEQTRTISLRLDRLSDTSVVIRMPAAKEPAAKEARNGPSTPSMIKRSSDRKAAVACEPPVSVLTEIAKQLQPGRCVT